MEANSKIRVAAVFATMDRAHVADACVKALQQQTRPPDWVVVADNASRDATVEVLRGLSDLPFVLEVLALPENGGNAGGVDAAMEYAFRNGMDAVWILDDDSYPRERALEAMLSVDLNTSVVRHAIQLEPNSARLTWPMWIRQKNGWRLIQELGEFGGRECVETRASWTGALISKEIRDEVGPVNGDLFIRGEDEEYPWRISQAGFSFSAITGAVLDHVGPQQLRRLRWGRKHFFYEAALSDAKLYYKVRNMVWLQKQQRGVIRAIAMALAYGMIGMSIDGFRRFPLLWEAVCDGWSGRLGRRKE